MPLELVDVAAVSKGAGGGSTHTSAYIKNISEIMATHSIAGLLWH